MIEKRFRAKKLFSPRQVSEAIGVSESSLKRWCDAGHIDNQKTAGGHRRMSMADVIKFLRRRQMHLEKPDILGLELPELNGVGGLGDFRIQAAQAIEDDDQELFSSLCVRLYLENWPIEEVMEEILSVAIPRTSRNWDLGNMQIRQECRVAEICKATFTFIREMVATPNHSTLKAIGGCLTQADYGLTAAAADLALAERGWNSRNLGHNLSISSLCLAAKKENPALVFIVVPQVPQDVHATIEIKRGLNLISATLSAGVTLVIAPNETPTDFAEYLNSVSIVQNLTGMASLLNKHFVLPS